MIPGSANALLLTTAAAGAYSIERSVRSNSSDSAYLSRTPASAGNRKTWTWAGWVKRSNTDSNGAIIFSSSPSAGANTYICFAGSNSTATTADGISFFSAPLGVNVGTAAVFRDFSAWFHLVVTVDTTQATAANRVKIYINGTEAAYASTAYPSSSQDLGINAAFSHTIGTTNSLDGWAYFDGYLADIHFIDGQALDPTSFGEFDDNGIWQPIEYSGSFGTNGFHLPFDDNSTAAALGTDTSGNGNTWTVNNISVAAGAGNDSLVDVPTNGTASSGGDAGGVVRGNYCTLNPLATAGSMTNGNLNGVNPNNTTTHATFAIPSSGKWYFEAVMTNAGVLNLGLAAYRPSGHVYTITNSVLYSSSGVKNVDGVLDQAYGASFSSGDVIGVACDADAGTITFYKNNSSQGALTHQIGGLFPSFGNGGVSTNYTVNFGQRPFAYTAPSGFKALCTANLPAPVIAKPSTVMDALTWVGNNTNNRAITGLNFSPDFIWIKNRTNASENSLFDAVRGVAKTLYSNQTAAELSSSAYGHVSSFDSAGFTLANGSDATYPNLATNYLNSNIVGWCWDAGTSTVTNTQGSITSSVRANATSGFSVATYTGTGANATVGHGLGVAPGLVIVKCRSAANDWAVYHSANTSDPKTDYLLLNSTAATADDNTYWNDTAPTSTVFSIGTNADVNTNTATYVAYCWAPLVGYSSMGSYVGNGSTDGPFVYTGFRPRWILIKRSTNAQPWNIYDTARDSYNIATQYLFPNSSQAEAVFGAYDIVSNGFKMRTTDLGTNGSGNTYIYAAFAESPFQFSRAR